MRPRILLSIAWTACLAIPILIALLYAANAQPIPAELVAGVAVVLFNIAAVPFLVTGLQQFKHELRRAFVFISVGIILYGVAQLQFPLAASFDLTLWVNSGAVVLPFIVSVTLLLIGVAKFGKLLQVKSRWFKLRWAYPAAIVIAVLSTFIPHAPTSLPDSEFAVSVGLNNWVMTIVFFIAMSVWRIRGAVAPRYQKTFNWLFASFALLVLSGLHYSVVSYVAMESWYASSAFMYAFTLIGAVCFMQAAYAFTQITVEADTKADANSPIDVIMYVASMASNPAAIDPLLDTLRNITATVPDQARLNTSQEQELAKLYGQLENYLVHGEPLQQITSEGLREAVRNRFQFDTASKSTFWKLFKEKSA